MVCTRFLYFKISMSISIKTFLKTHWEPLKNRRHSHDGKSSFKNDTIAKRSRNLIFLSKSKWLLKKRKQNVSKMDSRPSWRWSNATFPVRVTSHSLLDSLNFPRVCVPENVGLVTGSFREICDFRIMAERVFVWVADFCRHDSLHAPIGFRLMGC